MKLDWWYVNLRPSQRGAC